MNNIKIMSESLANKIAAGEVVEKCASVVKELVENSIDAGATKLKVELIDAGITSIKIIDNGSGMAPEDALLAFQRHATSKLIYESDLFFINTLGFRGEALPSIASVSKIELLTNAGDVGTLIKIDGGKLISNEKSPGKRGTSITVSDLFFNTPARLKYLKSEQTELANTVSYIEKLALSYPNIAFNLTNNDHKLVTTSGSGNLLKTIHEIYGLNISSNMLEISGENEDFTINGYICKPQILKSNRNHMITIVNGRVVKNNDINNFINEAYYTYKPDTKYPVVILNIETDPTLIDVNIHPTKQDIKISKIKELEELIVTSIKTALYNSLLIQKAPLNLNNNDNKIQIIAEKTKDTNEINEDQVTFDFAPKENIKEELTFFEKNEELKNLVLYPIGLALGTYIIAQNEEGIYLIDQHAAQERINYEKYLKSLKEKEVLSTSILIPITIELSASEFMSIKENMNILIDLGFKVEEFGINTFIFKEHPIWLKVGYEEESIRKIIDLIIIHAHKFDEIKFNENIAITLACKMSIKANTHISSEDMEELLNKLVSCDNPYNCPHGRPTIIKFTTYEIEKMFKRVM